MVYATSDIEKSFWEKGYKLICGIDEVGRGSFAGPVVAGAVIFSPDCIIPEHIADSKLLNPKKRETISKLIKQAAVCWSIGVADVPVIDEQGIGLATQLAFLKAIDSLKVSPDFLIIDAFYVNYISRKFQNPIKHGDRLSVSIAAASIIAKVYRDRLMEEFDLKYPGYDFAIHKGYGTKAHRDLIKKIGLCGLHRKSFNLRKFL